MANAGRNRRRRKQPFRTQVGSRKGVQGGGGVNKPPFPQNFLPDSPEFESGRRGLTDQYYATRQGLLNEQSLIEPQLKVQMERLGTNRGYDIKALDENLAGRGIYTSGIRPQLQRRDIDIPFGRNQQDLAQAAAQAYAGITSGLGSADLSFNQGLQELLLGLADQQATEQPLALAQYGPKSFKKKRRKKKGRK